jgi:thiamine kinase-like enzyme
MAPSTGLPQVDAVVERVPMFATAAELSAEPLSGGLTNTSYLLDADGEQFVVRVAGSNTEVLGIDREREAAAIQRAAAAGIAPDTVAFLLPEGHSVTRFLADAEPVSLDQARTETYLTRIAERLGEIHRLEPIDAHFDPYDDISGWMALSNRRGVAMPVGLGTLLDRIERVRLDRMVALESAVLCHNDSYYLNVLDDGQLWVIDWEYAGMGDPFFDLAANAFELDARRKETLLSAYFGEVTDAHRRTLDDMISVFLAWNIAWSLVQVHESDVDYDYATFADSLLRLVPPETG